MGTKCTHIRCMQVKRGITSILSYYTEPLHVSGELTCSGQYLSGAEARFLGDVSVCVCSRGCAHSLRSNMEHAVARGERKERTLCVPPCRLEGDHQLWASDWWESPSWGRDLWDPPPSFLPHTPPLLELPPSSSRATDCLSLTPRHRYSPGNKLQSLLSSSLIPTPVYISWSAFRGFFSVMLWPHGLRSVRSPLCVSLRDC